MNELKQKCPKLSSQKSSRISSVAGQFCGHRPIFNATLRAAAGWLFFRPAAAGLDPYESGYGRFTASPARTALKNSQLIRRPPGDIIIICETAH